MEFEYPIETIIKPHFEKFVGQSGYFIENTRTYNYFKANAANDDLQTILLKVGDVREPELAQARAEDAMAEHILSLNIDDQLAAADTQVVMDIANLDFRGERRYFYAFASRYCCYHFPKDYPIYDPTIEQLLKLFFKRNQDRKLSKDEILNYSSFKELMVVYKDNFHLPLETFWGLDKFIWTHGKQIIEEFREKNKLEGFEEYLAALDL